MYTVFSRLEKSDSPPRSNTRPRKKYSLDDIACVFSKRAFPRGNYQVNLVFCETISNRLVLLILENYEMTIVLYPLV